MRGRFQPGLPFLNRVTEAALQRGALAPITDSVMGHLTWSIGKLDAEPSPALLDAVGQELADRCARPGVQNMFHPDIQAP